MRKVLEALRRALVPHVTSPLKIVAVRQLHYGSIYVADIDGRRLIFVLGAHGVGLLTSYEAPAARAREEPATPAV